MTTKSAEGVIWLVSRRYGGSSISQRCHYAAVTSGSAGRKGRERKDEKGREEVRVIDLARERWECTCEEIAGLIRLDPANLGGIAD